MSHYIYRISSRQAELAILVPQVEPAASMKQLAAG